jgi:drug/metabolite transporter (DMT)-like permease
MMVVDLRVIGIAAALGSAASWALGSILFKQLGERISPLAMTLAKGGVSTILLGIAVLVTGHKTLEPQSFWLLMGSGVLGITLGDTFFFEALQDLGPHTLVLFLLLGQVLTVILAIVFLGEIPTTTSGLGITLVLVGIGIVLLAELSSERRNSRLRGLLFGSLSVVCISVSMIIAKLGIESVSALEATFIRMVSGTLGTLLLGLLMRRLGYWITPFRDLKLSAFFLASVCVVTFGGFWLSLVAIKYVDVSIANTLNSTEPLFLLPFTAIFLKQKVGLSAWVGTAIAFAGIVLLCMS